MSNATKDRLIISALLVAALPFAICFVPWAHTALEASLDLCPWAHMTLEACLNSLWILLAVGALARWVFRDGNRCRGHLPGLVSVAFVLSLLFPAISVNDDLAQLDLINDAKSSQSLITSVKKDKEAAPAVKAYAPSAVAAHILIFVPPAFEFISDAAAPAVNAAVLHATGNHSPPPC